MALRRRLKLKLNMMMTLMANEESEKGTLMQESVNIKSCVKQIGQAVKSSSESAIAFWHLTRF